MKIIGITGPSGSGKSLLCRMLVKRDIPCIDADGVYHSLLLPPSDCLDAIRRVFGEGVFLDSGELDRVALGTIVFQDSEKLELLNSTVLDFVLDEIRRMIKDYGKKGYGTVAVDAPTLIESGFNRECTAVISVLAPESVRLARIMDRDSITEEKARMRIAAQKKDEFYKKASDFVLVNDGSNEKFGEKVADLLSDELFAACSKGANDEKA